MFCCRLAPSFFDMRLESCGFGRVGGKVGTIFPLKTSKTHFQLVLNYQETLTVTIISGFREVNLSHMHIDRLSMRTRTGKNYHRWPIANKHKPVSNNIVPY